MSRTIWNEGRVVGYSAYEVYVRQLLAEDPDATPATEKEWLSTMLAMGSSMLLRIGTDDVDGLHYVEVEFPEDSRLCAANMIMASCFLGVGVVDGTATSTGWCYKVGDFGPLIHNVSGDSPSHDGTSIPPTQQDITGLPSYTIAGIRNYMKIVDGIIIQPGTWTVTSNTPPWKDFTPTLSEVPKIRILLSGKVDSAFYILLTGFTDKGVVVGTTGFSSAVNTPSPENGDFLGPAAFPWSAKVIFSVPTAFLNYYSSTDYSRKLPDTAESEAVTDAAIIDMNATNPDDYYTTHYSDAPVDIIVDNLSVSGENGAILTVYQVHSDVPPALFGARIPNATTGDYVICPIDTIAPGNPKVHDVFVNDADTSTVITNMLNLEDNASGTSAYVRDIGQILDQTTNPATYVLYQRDKFTDSVIPVAKVDNTNLYGMLTAREIYYGGQIDQPSARVGAFLCMEGTGPAKYFDTPVHTDGSEIDWSTYDIWTETDWKMKLKDGCEVLKSILPSYAQEDIDNTGYISAVSVLYDPTPYCPTLNYVYKRITGRLSDKVQSACGYEVYTDNTTKSATFSSGGFWENALTGMFTQIDGDKSDYYGLVMNPIYSNNHVWPVHKNDHVIDVTVLTGYGVLVNGEPINLIGFDNDPDSVRTTKLLGSYWDASTSIGYHNQWCVIDRTSPMVSSTIPANATGQVFAPNALLPESGRYHVVRLTDLYPNDVLQFYGIHPDYWTYTLGDFLQIAIYTDMGTKKPIDPQTYWGNTNTHQPQRVTKRTTSEPIVEAFSFDVTNNASTVGRTQLIPLPKAYQSTANYPVGTMIQTGRLQGVALSMLDANGVPYILEGSADDIVVPDTGLTWNDLIEALYTNKSLNILGDKLATLRANIKTVGDDYIEFQNGKRITGV